MAYSFDADVWLYPGEAAWHFITVPLDMSQEIKAMTAERRRGFGSVRVEVTIGDYKWQTSIFPDSKSGCYFLPVKKEARLKNNLEPGSKTRLTITLADN